jgi:hypothetical protein
MERASQVVHYHPYAELSSQSITQAFITFAWISIPTHSHQRPPAANQRPFGRIRMRHHRPHPRQNPYLAQGALTCLLMKRIQTDTALLLSEHAPVQGWLR